MEQFSGRITYDMNINPNDKRIFCSVLNVSKQSVDCVYLFFASLHSNSIAFKVDYWRFTSQTCQHPFFSHIIIGLTWLLLYSEQAVIIRTWVAFRSTNYSRVLAHVIRYKDPRQNIGYHFALLDCSPDFTTLKGPMCVHLYRPNTSKELNFGYTTFI